MLYNMFNRVLLLYNMKNVILLLYNMKTELFNYKYPMWI